MMGQSCLISILPRKKTSIRIVPPLRAKQQSSRFDPLTNAKSARQQTTADAFLMESDVHHFVFSQSILKTPF
ncbi:hypothetical protein, partial [Geobacillus stearothermophilus]|uniref:hypothetical protein n=1 Tax=Geobacillus stearothermophilus TaxID=1422 RepID=UPI003B98489B